MKIIRIHCISTRFAYDVVRLGIWGPRMRALFILAGFFFLTSVAAAQSQSLKIAYSPDWAPYSITKDGVTTGILPALLDELITRQLGVPIDHVGLPWKRGQAQVKAGVLDALITYPSKARLEYTERSASVVYQLESKAFVRKGSKAHTELLANPGIENLKNYRGCVLLGNDWAEKFYKTHSIPYQSAVDVKNCLRLLERGRVDIYIQSAAVALDNIRQLNFQESLVPLPKAYTSLPLVLLISKKSPFYGSFLPKFNALIAEMKADGSLDAFIAKLENAPQS